MVKIEDVKSELENAEISTTTKKVYLSRLNVLFKMEEFPKDIILCNGESTLYGNIKNTTLCTMYYCIVSKDESPDPIWNKSESYPIKGDVTNG